MNNKNDRWTPEFRHSAPIPEPKTPSPIPRAKHVAMKESSTISESSREAPSPETGSEDLELNAIIGAGTAFHGTLSFSGQIRIDGEFSGRALGGRLLVIGDGAVVSGELRAQKVLVLGGKVEANINATEAIEMFVPAVVSGDLRSPQIYMDRGIEFQGTCDMTGDHDER